MRRNICRTGKFWIVWGFTLILPGITGATTITVEDLCSLYCDYDLDADGIDDASAVAAPLDDTQRSGAFFPYSYPPSDSLYLDGYALSTYGVNVIQSAPGGVEPGVYFYPLVIKFNYGATDYLQFGSGFINTTLERFQVFDRYDRLLADEFTTSGTRTSTVFDSGNYWTEELVSIAFAGTASYAVIQYDGGFGSRYMVDNITGGIIGSATVVPLPGSLMFLASGLAGLFLRRRR